MITYAEAIMFAVYFAMAGYIVYLQHRLRQATEAGATMAMVLRDVANGELEIERYSDGFKIVRKGEVTREVSVHQRGTH